MSSQGQEAVGDDPKMSSPRNGLSNSSSPAASPSPSSSKTGLSCGETHSQADESQLSFWSSKGEESDSSSARVDRDVDGTIGMMVYFPFYGKVEQAQKAADDILQQLSVYLGTSVRCELQKFLPKS